MRYINPLTEERVEVRYKQKEHCDTLSPNVNNFVAPSPVAGRVCDFTRLWNSWGNACSTSTPTPLSSHTSEVKRPLSSEIIPGQFQERARVGRCHRRILSKNYGYQTWAVQTICKVRGFSLNVQGREQLIYEILPDNTLAELERPLTTPRTTRVVQSHTIVRDAKAYVLHTRPAHKDYRLVFSKRVLDPDSFQIYP